MSNGVNQSDSAGAAEETTHAALARRNVLRLGGMAAAGAAAAAVVAATDASPAGADTGTMVYGTTMDAGTTVTELMANPSELSTTFRLTSSGDGPALQSIGGNGLVIEALGGVSNPDAGHVMHVRHFGSGDGIFLETETGTGVFIKSTGVALQAEAKHGSTADCIQTDALAGHGIVATNQSDSNAAVKAQANGKGPAVQAIGAGGNGTALDVHGRATFNRSGLLPIPAGAKSATTREVPGGLTESSHVLATIQTHTTETVAVRAAVPSTAYGKITIYLTNEAPAGGLKVAWLVIG